MVQRIVSTRMPPLVEDGPRSDEFPIRQSNLQPQIQVFNARESPRLLKASDLQQSLLPDNRSAGCYISLPMPEFTEVNRVEPIGVNHPNIRGDTSHLNLCLLRVPTVVVIEKRYPLSGGSMNSGISRCRLAPV